MNWISHQETNNSLVFSNGKRKFIAFLKWEKEVHYFSQMGKIFSLLFSKRKRYFILDFLDRKSPKSLGVALSWGIYCMANLQPNASTSFCDYISTFPVVAIGLPSVSLALWSGWACASCAGQWRGRGAWGRRPGAVGGGFVGSYPLPIPPPTFCLHCLGRLLPRWVPPPSLSRS